MRSSDGDGGPIVARPVLIAVKVVVVLSEGIGVFSEERNLAAVQKAMRFSRNTGVTRVMALAVGSVRTIMN